MKKTTKKPQKRKPRDINELAFSIVESLTSEDDVKAESIEAEEEERDAVILGRKGGKKGGKARAQKLSPEHRAAIAKKAAKKRWSKKTAS
jgi:hypothetical protein